MKQKLVVLTGAGISAESGLKTFRDSDGLWNGYRVEEVASPEGFLANPQLVLDFYNMRRKDAAEALPNQAHVLLAELENQFDVQIITQNVDDLHERAGSTKVLHLHGELNKMCSVADKDVTYPFEKEIHIGDKAPDGQQLRPFIVWFGEAVPLIDMAIDICKTADIFVVIGTSLQVYPAAGLTNYVPKNAPIYIIDKNIPDIKMQERMIVIENVATEGVLKLKERLTASN